MTDGGPMNEADTQRKNEGIHRFTRLGRTDPHGTTREIMASAARGVNGGRRGPRG